jgi:hypothetical protein
MAETQSIFLTNQNRENLTGAGLPVISQSLDSVRAYQFEIHFTQIGDVDGSPTDLTLAAKQVTTAGFATEDIEVNRINDKVFYPGKASPDEITVTFDNLSQQKVATTLWKWFQSIYNPMTGKMADVKTNDGWKAKQVSILNLDPNGQPLMETKLFGVYPKSWKTAEFNYGTNDFHTIELVLRYDFMDHVNR